MLASTIAISQRRKPNQDEAEFAPDLTLAGPDLLELGGFSRGRWLALQNPDGRDECDLPGDE